MFIKVSVDLFADGECGEIFVFRIYVYLFGLYLLFGKYDSKLVINELYTSIL